MRGLLDDVGQEKAHAELVHSCPVVHQPRCVAEGESVLSRDVIRYYVLPDLVEFRVEGCGLSVGACLGDVLVGEEVDQGTLAHPRAPADDHDVAEVVVLGLELLPPLLADESCYLDIDLVENAL